MQGMNLKSAQELDTWSDMSQSASMSQLPAITALADGTKVPQMSVTCKFEDGHDVVRVHAGPVKSLRRMREKLAEYAAPNPRSTWPLSANVLDPVRASVVTHGPQRICEVVRWCVEAGLVSSEEGSLQVCRVKNLFALERTEVPDGYRDVKLFLLFTCPSGLSIIGEVQVTCPP